MVHGLEEDADDPGWSQSRKKLNEIVRILKRMLKTLNKVLVSSFQSERLERQILKLSNIVSIKNDKQFEPLSILLTYDQINVRKNQILIKRYVCPLFNFPALLDLNC